jgi:hypothetical protein
LSHFTLPGPVLSDNPIRLTDGSATIVFTASGVTPISSIICTPTNGTPNLTIEIYNAAGASAMTLRKAVAMTAGTAFIFNEVLTLNPGETIRVTSSSGSGEIDVLVTRGLASAAAALRPN